MFRLSDIMLINCLMLPTVLTTLALLGEVSGQVNSEIDQFEDLLAVDSFDNEVKNMKRPLHFSTFTYILLFEVVVIRPRSRKVFKRNILLNFYVPFRMYSGSSEEVKFRRSVQEPGEHPGQVQQAGVQGGEVAAEQDE